MDAETHAQVLALERLTTARLRQRYAEIFGEPTLVQNKAWLVKRIAWRLQAMAEGDLSERARRRAAELANDADLRLNPPRENRVVTLAPTTIAPVSVPVPPPPTPTSTNRDPRLPPPGSILTRKYKGRDLQVLVLANGFQFEGKTYASLSAIARAVTGQHQNGFLFFKLTDKGDAR